MRHRFLLTGLLALSLGVFVNATLSAGEVARPYQHPCLCPQLQYQHHKPRYNPWHLQGAFDQADVVLKGRVASIERRKADYSLAITLEVQGIWKGDDTESQITVLTPIGWAEGRVAFRAGVLGLEEDAKKALPELSGEYIVFANRSYDSQGREVFVTVAPTRTRMAYLAKDDIAALGEPKKPAGGRKGRDGDGEPEVPGRPGRRVPGRVTRLPNAW